jgi:hypothetical protein
MKLVLVVLVGAHGLVHLIGFLKGFGLVSGLLPGLPIGRGAGALWLVAALLFVTSSAVLLAAPSRFFLPALPALLLSQALVLGAWQAAKYATFMNAVVLFSLLPSLFALRPSSFPRVYAQEMAARLARPSARLAPVTQTDLARLPALVARYLERVGVVGKPIPRDFRARFRGQMRPSESAGVMPIEAEQYERFDEPARLFLIRAESYGVPFEALHVFSRGVATMRVRVASLLDVVDAKGPLMNQSETVTLLNDMCLLAPATLLDPRLAFREVDERHVEVTLENAGVRVGATLEFDQAGDLVSFVSPDRYLSADGKRYEKLPWSTPVGDYRDFGGLRLAARGEARWHRPSGDLTYAHFELVAIEYDVAPSVTAVPAPAPEHLGSRSAR